MTRIRERKVLRSDANISVAITNQISSNHEKCRIIRHFRENVEHVDCSILDPLATAACQRRIQLVRGGSNQEDNIPRHMVAFCTEPNNSEQLNRQLEDCV